MLCDIIVVNWNRAVDTCACILSLEGITDIDWYAVVCDNGSSDESGLYLRHYLAGSYTERVRADKSSVFDYYITEDETTPRITLVLSATNLGFAGGNNLACRYVFPARKADFIWFLNNDTEVAPDALSKMIDRIQQDQTIGICGSTLVYAHDRETVQTFGGVEFQPWTGLTREIGQGEIWPCAVDRAVVEARMRYVYGASMLVTRNFLDQVGPMCEDYFLYYEEIDWAERARKAGFRLGYAPESLVYHKEGGVLGSGKSNRRSMKSEYYGLYGRLLATRRFFPWALPTVYFFALLQIGRRCIQGHWSRARMMAAVLLGLRRIPPKD